MLFKKCFTTLSLLVLLSLSAQAEQPALNAFTSGSYRQILAKHTQEPFMLVIWSTTCPSCVKDMTLLNALHKSWPKLKMVLLATDVITDAEQVQTILAKHELTGLENWVFAEDNTQKLNYEIDPEWYGELPRTYFFDAAHGRQGMSGVLSKQDYESLFAKILKPSVKAY
ncbi:MAG: hypothetical protein HOP02_08390 [Methylococcaceae bacterium]|nr:hypothetical protein [Methylococcaceae bacterium]